MLGDVLVRPEETELSPLPEGSKFFLLPSGRSLGWNPVSDEFVGTDEGLTAVSAFPAPSYTRTLLPAVRILVDPILHLC